MNKNKIAKISFNSDFIERTDLSYESASDCKLRSSFVHEKLLQSKNKEICCSVTLQICERGVKITRDFDKIVLHRHSIQQITYCACDRISRLFALVVRYEEKDRSQTCFLFRMHTSEQADSINRYFGSIFKLLQYRRKENRAEIALVSSELIHDSPTSTRINDKEYNSDYSFDCNGTGDRHKDTFTCLTDDSLVDDTHNTRRLSLSMPSTECEEDDDEDHLQPLHSSLEKKRSLQTTNNIEPQQLLRRKKTDYKVNRISAVIERLSFRGNKDMSSDLSKCGSPVVALKEQLEYEELLFVDSSLGSESSQHRKSSIGSVPKSQPKKQLIDSNLCISNDSKAALSSHLARNNSAPTSIQEEQPPVPPVRIHSLRYAPCIEDVCHRMAEYDDNDEEDFSSCDRPEDHGPVSLPMCNDRVRHSEELLGENDRSQRNGAVSQSWYTEVPSKYFRDLNKEEAMSCLVDREMGAFLVRHSGSHRGSLALSVKVRSNTVSHYIVEPQNSGGYRLKGLDKSWPDLDSLLIHLSVIPEMLPCPIKIADVLSAPRSLSVTAAAQYQHPEHTGTHLSVQYQQLSQFSSLLADSTP